MQTLHIASAFPTLVLVSILTTTTTMYLVKTHGGTCVIGETGGSNGTISEVFLTSTLISNLATSTTTTNPNINMLS